MNNFECPRCGHCCQSEVNKDMKRIKTWSERCEEHPDHQERIITERMIQARMQEEIDELRQALETEREWVGLTKEEMFELFEKYSDRPFSLMLATHDKVKEKNT